MRLGEGLAVWPFTNSNGKNTIMTVNVDARTDGMISCVPVNGRIGGSPLIPLDVPVDVLKHNNGVIDDKPGSKRKTAEGDRIEREPAKIEKRKGGDDRNRNREGNHERTAQISQEKRNDQDRQHAADNGGLLRSEIESCTNCD